MKFTVLPNKNLEVALETEDDPEEVLGWRNEWWRIFDEKIGNGWGIVSPEWIGAMTDAPIVTDGHTVHDDGTNEVFGEVWWFPNYCVEDPIETLAKNKRVVFKHAPKEGESR